MDIKHLAEKYNEYIIEKRRWFHQYPELSGHEVNTTNEIIKELESMGLKPRRLEGIEGCYADLVGDKDGPIVMLRADIDAIAATEETGLPFASAYPGVMHACGHDCHIAVQLGAAKILTELSHKIAGTVRFYFQAEEEVARGAKTAVELGLTEGVSACYAMHVWGGLESCRFNMEYGERMASSDWPKLTVNGATAHASAPHQGSDALLAAASIVMNWQAITSRLNDPMAPKVLTISTIHGGTRFNTLADKVTLEGSARAYSNELRDTIEKQMENIARHTAEAFGCSIDFKYDRLVGPVVNQSAELVTVCRNAAEKLYGSNFLINMNKLPASEDYGHIMESIPSIFGFLGVTHKDVPGSELSNHHQCFTVDENALHMGSGVAAQFALDWLESLRESK